MLVGLLLPGIGLIYIAVAPGVAKRRRIQLIARCVLIGLTFVVANLIVGDLDRVTAFEKMVITAAAVSVIALLIGPSEKGPPPLDPDGEGGIERGSLTEFVLGVFLDHGYLRAMRQVADVDRPAWRSGWGTAHWYFESEMPAAYLDDGTSTEEIVDLATTFCLAVFVPMLRERSEPETGERLTVFCLGFTWALRNLIDDQMARPRERRTKKASRDERWAI